MKDKKQKELLIDSLKKIPIIMQACQRVEVSRSTYYRWRKDKKFAKLADDALMEGVLMINDLAESQLISSIKDGSNMTSLIFWLKNRYSSVYGDKVQIKGKIKTDPVLTKEQKALIKKALLLSDEKKHEKD